MIFNAFDNGLSEEKFYIVSHSLGSQVAGKFYLSKKVTVPKDSSILYSLGVIGRHISVESEQSKKISRISGLDPAFPAFFPDFFFKHLTHDDAKFVDIIHTDAGLYGMPISTGHVS